MLMGLGNLAFLTEIEIGAHAALVADSLNWLGLATIACHSIVDLSGLVSCALAQIVNH
jgi:hypothetical protein